MSRCGMPVFDGLMPLLATIVLLGNIGIDAAELPSVFGGAEIIFDGFFTLAHLTVYNTERVGHIGIGRILIFECLQKR